MVGEEAKKAGRAMRGQAATLGGNVQRGTRCMGEPSEPSALGTHQPPRPPRVARLDALAVNLIYRPTKCERSSIGAAATEVKADGTSPYSHQQRGK